MSSFQTSRVWLAAAVLVMFAAPAWADIVVYPTGSYPTDVVAVQAAVMGGGTVRLKAVNAAGDPTSFNFGPAVAGSGGVELTTDVEIRGETRGGWMTTIRGGNMPFRGFVPVRSTISGIRFEGPRIAAVYVDSSAGIEISDNVITAVVGFPWFGSDRKGQGVWIQGLSPVTGTITIARNTITDIDAEDGLGLAIADVEADVRIIGNRIRGTNAWGILVFVHAGRVWIEGNDVVPGPERFPGFYSIGNGIQVGPNWGAFSPRPIPEASGPAYIVNNRVVAENPNADGILVYGWQAPLDGSVVAGNRVTMSDSLYGGITLLDNVSRSLVAANDVRGTGAVAIDIIGAPEVTNRGNVLAGNRVVSFTATIADVLLDQSTADTLVAGCHGTIIDLGVNNRVVGCHHLSQPAPALRRSEEPRREQRMLDILRLERPPFD
jgi:hypothetical protein